MNTVYIGAMAGANGANAACASGCVAMSPLAFTLATALLVLAVWWFVIR